MEYRDKMQKKDTVCDTTVSALVKKGKCSDVDNIKSVSLPVPCPYHSMGSEVATSRTVSFELWSYISQQSLLSHYNLKPSFTLKNLDSISFDHLFINEDTIITASMLLRSK